MKNAACFTLAADTNSRNTGLPDWERRVKPPSTIPVSFLKKDMKTEICKKCQAAIVCTPYVFCSLKESPSIKGADMEARYVKVCPLEEETVKEGERE